MGNDPVEPVEPVKHCNEPLTRLTRLNRRPSKWTGWTNEPAIEPVELVNRLNQWTGDPVSEPVEPVNLNLNRWTVELINHLSGELEPVEPVNRLNQRPSTSNRTGWTNEPVKQRPFIQWTGDPVSEPVEPVNHWPGELERDEQVNPTVYEPAHMSDDLMRCTATLHQIIVVSGRYWATNPVLGHTYYVNTMWIKKPAYKYYVYYENVNKLHFACFWTISIKIIIFPKTVFSEPHKYQKYSR